MNTVVWGVVVIYTVAIWQHAKSLYSQGNVQESAEQDLKSGFGRVLLKLHSATHNEQGKQVMHGTV